MTREIQLLLHSTRSALELIFGIQQLFALEPAKAGESIKPVVERSETPGAEFEESGEPVAAVDSRLPSDPVLSNQVHALARYHGLESAAALSYPGVPLRFTPRLYSDACFAG